MKMDRNPIADRIKLHFANVLVLGGFSFFVSFAFLDGRGKNRFGCMSCFHAGLKYNQQQDKKIFQGILHGVSFF